MSKPQNMLVQERAKEEACMISKCSAKFLQMNSNSKSDDIFIAARDSAVSYFYESRPEPNEKLFNSSTFRTVILCSFSGDAVLRIALPQS